jgi:hypothetical protein
MPRNDDDLDDDDRPARRRPRDDEDSERSDRPRRRRDEDDEPPPKKKGNGVLIGILVGVFVVCCGGGGTVVYLIYRGVKKTVEQVGTTFEGFTESEQSRQNLMRIGTAAKQHEAAMGTFPNNSYETRPKGVRPLLSWRVHILPYIGEAALYRQFKLDEPWDSPNNKPLLNQMPAVYGTPAAQAKAGPGKTFYRGFSHNGGMFEKPTAPGNPPSKVPITAVVDGTSNTILVVDAGEAIEWTKPDDIDFGPGQPRPELGGAYPNVPYVMVLMCDGTVRKLIKTTPDATLRLLADRKDGEVIPIGWEQP